MTIFDNPDNWFNVTPKKTKKSAGGGGGFTAPTSRKTSSLKATTAKAVNAVNKNVPQAVIKISGASKGADKAQAHVNYIGRKGEIEIENQDGQRFKGDEQKELLKSWEAMGMPSEEANSKRKEALHFVFSMPKGTNPDGLKSAVRNLINEEFTGHQYFMAQHLDTDSPHVHVLLSASDDRGARLNPRKADLHNYRVQFVHKLAEQGIEATSSRRVHRFKHQEGKKQGQIHKEAREGAKPTKRPTSENMKNIEATHKEVVAAYKKYGAELPDGDTQLKNEVAKLLKNHEKGKDKGRS